MYRQPQSHPDLIYVVEGGRVIEYGDWDTLSARPEVACATRHPPVPAVKLTDFWTPAGRSLLPAVTEDLVPEF